MGCPIAQGGHNNSKVIYIGSPTSRPFTLEARAAVQRSVTTQAAVAFSKTFCIGGRCEFFGKNAWVDVWLSRNGVGHMA